MKTMRRQSFARGALFSAQGIGKVLTLLGVVALLSACYWQPEDTKTGLAVTLQLPAEFGAASTGEVGALQTEDDSFVVLVALDDRFITNEDRFYGVLRELIFAEGSQRLNDLNLELGGFWSEPGPPQSGASSDQLFTSARVFGTTFASNLEGSTTGSHVFSGLRADSTYIVYAYVFAGSEYEGMARDTVQVGETGSVSLNLETLSGGGPLSNESGSVFFFMSDNYGFADPPS